MTLPGCRRLSPEHVRRWPILRSWATCTTGGPLEELLVMSLQKYCGTGRWLN